ncbi:unnamed protein product, partial [marine sediment metagenome]
LSPLLTDIDEGTFKLLFANKINNKQKNRQDTSSY